MKKILFGAMALATVLSPVLAEAAEGYATANVNMRSGPSTAYPAVTVIPYGAPVDIHGCLADVPWCDVSFSGGRGWVAGRYLQTDYRQNRVYLEPRYYRPLGIPTVTFSVGTYWDRYYRNRDFYRERDRWDRGPSSTTVTARAGAATAIVTTGTTTARTGIVTARAGTATTTGTVTATATRRNGIATATGIATSPTGTATATGTTTESTATAIATGTASIRIATGTATRIATTTARPNARSICRSSCRATATTTAADAAPPARTIARKHRDQLAEEA